MCKGCGQGRRKNTDLFARPSLNPPFLHAHHLQPSPPGRSLKGIFFSESARPTLTQSHVRTTFQCVMFSPLSPHHFFPFQTHHLLPPFLFAPFLSSLSLPTPPTPSLARLVGSFLGFTLLQGNLLPGRMVVGVHSSGGLSLHPPSQTVFFNTTLFQEVHRYHPAPLFF